MQRRVSSFLTPRLQRYAANLSSNVRDRAPFVLRGLAAAASGVSSVVTDQGVWSQYSGFALEYGILCLILYALAILAFVTVLAPILIILLVVHPGTLVQVALLIPHWAYNISHEHNEATFESTFLKELRRLDAGYAADVEGKLLEAGHIAGAGQRAQGASAAGGAAGYGRSIRSAARRRHGWFSFLSGSGGMTRDSLRSWALGFIPVIGVGYTLSNQIFAISESMSLAVLEPWLDSKGLSLSNTPARRAFLEAGNTKWVLIGFGLPFAVIGAVPILGGGFQVLAQPAAAHLVYKVLDPPLVPTSQQQHQQQAPVSAGGVDEGVRQRRGMVSSAGAGVQSLRPAPPPSDVDAWLSSFTSWWSRFTSVTVPIASSIMPLLKGLSLRAGINLDQLLNPAGMNLAAAQARSGGAAAAVAASAGAEATREGTSGQWYPRPSTPPSSAAAAGVAGDIALVPPSAAAGRVQAPGEGAAQESQASGDRQLGFAGSGSFPQSKEATMPTGLASSTGIAATPGLAAAIASGSDAGARY